MNWYDALVLASLNQAVSFGFKDKTNLYSNSLKMPRELFTVGKYITFQQNRF